MARDPLDRGNGAGHHGHGPQGFDTMARDPLERMALAGAGGVATRSAGRPRRRGAPANRACPDPLRSGRAALPAPPWGAHEHRACLDPLRSGRAALPAPPRGAHEHRACLDPLRSGRAALPAPPWGAHEPPRARAESVVPRPGALSRGCGTTAGGPVMAPRPSFATRRPKTEATRSTGRLWRRGARASDGRGAPPLAVATRSAASDGMGNVATARRRAYFRRFQKSTPAAENRWPARQAKA